MGTSFSGWMGKFAAGSLSAVLVFAGCKDAPSDPPSDDGAGGEAATVASSGSQAGGSGGMGADGGMGGSGGTPSPVQTTHDCAAPDPSPSNGSCVMLP